MQLAVFGQWPPVPFCVGTAQILGATGAITRQNGRWLVSSARTGAGTYQLTLNTGKTGPIQNLDVQVLPRVGVLSDGFIANAIPGSSTVLLVTITNDAGVPTDAEFYIQVTKGGL